tara:strand:+ start:21 stop:194 length:174 start_codon:yes stop_codon:yes gene_type:complete
MIDPPSGWKYGFPKAKPDDVTNIIAWLLSEGYPQSEIDKMGNTLFIRTWEEMDHDRS